MRLSFVVCVSDAAVLAANLLASPCLAPGSAHQLIEVHDCRSAAEGFEQGMLLASGEILVFVHQDVFLPQGWDEAFISGFVASRRELGAEVVGVYGLAPALAGQAARPLGEVVDRGELLQGEEPLPARAQSLDELLFAVPRQSRLRLDPRLGFDLYATDLVLQAEARGGCGAVVRAACEHRSTLPRAGIPPAILRRFQGAAAVFEEKWAHRLPIETPCGSFSREEPMTGRIEAFLADSAETDPHPGHGEGGDR
ncbi:MAG: glycosyltransferase [Thermodesulfobacteriota bacterium]